MKEKEIRLFLETPEVKNELKKYIMHIFNVGFLIGIACGISLTSFVFLVII